MRATPWREIVEELWRRRLRTALTLLGMVFGVGAIVAMLGVGEGSRREALSLIEGLGLRNLIVNATKADAETQREQRARSAGLRSTDALAALGGIPGAELVAGEKEYRAHLVLGPRGSEDILVSGVDADYFELSNLSFAEGRAFTPTEASLLRPLAVLGDQAARALFGDRSAIGQPVKINHAWFEVVGVLADRDLKRDQFAGLKLNLEANRAYIPLPSAQSRLRLPPLEAPLDRFILRVADAGQIASAARVLDALIRERHGGVDDYSLVVPAQLYRQHQQTQRIFQFVMAAIAGVSLLVGGIGIMNIMLANVLERRREIGLKRALGARQLDIVDQFLRETALIALVGAAFGLLFGVLLAYLIAAFAGWPVAWSPWTVLPATLACAAVGLAFGVYPAREASRLDPIAALRSD